jgi:LytS/YehU family sensor histidine kinase
MITQPFIENAVKHGLKNILQKGQIAISYTLETDKLFFTIQDNGEGFQEIEKDSTKKSMAMKITKERLKSISNKSDFEVHLNNILDDNKKSLVLKFFLKYLIFTKNKVNVKSHYC